jgi:hypothetical protein
LAAALLVCPPATKTTPKNQENKYSAGQQVSIERAPSGKLQPHNLNRPSCHPDIQCRSEAIPMYNAELKPHITVGLLQRQRPSKYKSMPLTKTNDDTFLALR